MENEEDVFAACEVSCGCVPSADKIAVGGHPSYCVEPLCGVVSSACDCPGHTRSSATFNILNYSQATS